MNYTDTLELELIKRSRPSTDRERVLLEALEEETAVKDTLAGLFSDYPSTDDIRPDLERIKKTLEELRQTADKEAEAWFETNDTLPRLDATEAPMERLAALCLAVSGLFDDTLMDFEDLEALTLAGEVFEIAEKAFCLT